MEKQPLTFRQAADILQNYSYLKGQTFTIDNQEYTIQWVTIAPFENEEQIKFVEKVYYLEDWKLALHTYAGNTFDIMVIAVNQKVKLDFTGMDIASYLEYTTKRIKRPSEEMMTAA